MIDAGTENLIKASLEQGRRAGDALASIVQDVNIEKMVAKMILKDEFGTEVVVEIDLNLTANRNINKLYEIRSKLLVKKQKTDAAVVVALKNAKKSALIDIKKQQLVQRKRTVQQNRKPLWFEKFFWFLSSENFLVISARDAQQNEVLIKRYVQKSDFVFHAQIQGSAFTVVKNPQAAVLPPITCIEAAQATAAHSKAWELKVAVEVYWITANQVSKSTPTGLYLPMGSFMIYGKKNFVQLQNSEMSVALLWRVDEDSAKAHQEERKPHIAESEVVPIQGDNFSAQPELLEVGTKEKLKKNDKQPKTEKQKKQNEKPKIQKETKDVEKKTPIEDKTTKLMPTKPKVTKKILEKMKKYAEKFADENSDERELRTKTLGIIQSKRVDKLFNSNQFPQKIKSDELQIKKISPIKEIIEEANSIVQPQVVEKKVFSQKKQTNQNEIEEEPEDLVEEDYKLFTGNPFVTDTIFEVLVVCAPYSTVPNPKPRLN